MTRYLESETSSTQIIKVYILCIDRDLCVGETIVVRGAKTLLKYTLPTIANRVEKTKSSESQ